MAFVTTHPAALAAAANTLQGINSAMAAQDAAAAAPTTGVAPAAADEVSALQATLFSAYGQLYQQVSAQATTIQELFVQTLRGSGDSYDATEAANAVAANPTQESALSPNLLGLAQFGNFGSAASDLLQLGSSGFLAPGALAGSKPGAFGGLSGSFLTGSVEPTASAGFGGTPPVASMGQASSIGRLSVPPGWAGAAEAVSGTAPEPMRLAGWTAPAPQSPPVTTLPAGMPSVASTERGGFGFGAPRYGVKPKVMPRPAVV